MEYTTYTEEMAEKFREKLIEYYKMHNLDPIFIKQVKDFDIESLLCMAVREAIHSYDFMIEQKI